MSKGIEYEYIGPSAFFVDRHSGSGCVWIGKGRMGEATLDELRSAGNIKGVDPVFAKRFEAINVNCEVPQFRRITPKGVAAKAAPDADLIPTGTQYSGYSADQIRGLYIDKTGKRSTSEQTLAELVKEIQHADVDLLLAGTSVDDL
jgi:hypothetical protein